MNFVFNSLARRLVIFLIILAASVACGSSDSEKAAEHYFAGTEFAAAGDWQEAIAEFDESVRLDPDAVDPHTTRGAVYAEPGQFQKAIDDYNEAIRIGPETADVYYNRAVAYGALENFDASIDDYSWAIELDPRNTDAFLIGGSFTATRAGTNWPSTTPAMR